jgi:dihydrofolate reductase
MKCSVFIATTLDGFISRRDGSIDWLENANGMVPTGEDCGYGEFMATVDALVMGRNTFEMAITFDPWPYGTTPVIIMSSRLKSLPPATPATVSLFSGSPEALLSEAASRNLKHLYIDGGLTIQGFLAAGLIDDITITKIPVLLGDGKPLFGPLPKDVKLEHISTHSYPFGFVQSRYRIAKEAMK